MPIPVVPGELASDTGPQRALALVQAGMTQTEVAAELHVAQSTVSRWLKDADLARLTRDIHYRAIARDAALVIVVLCAVIIAAAMASIAWG